MFASFHSKGTIPSCSDMLNTCASGILICSTISFSILGDIPSTPGDLFSFILLILLATTSGVTTNCPNFSPSEEKGWDNSAKMCNQVVVIYESDDGIVVGR